MKFLRSALAALVLVALAMGAGCSSVRGTALTVNGREYSRSSVNHELSAIADNTLLHKQVADSDGTLKATLTAVWLTALAEQQVVNRELSRSKIEVTSDDRRAGHDQAVQYFGSARVFDAFPKWFRARVDDRFARKQALLRQSATPPTDVDVRAAYDREVEQIKSNCQSQRFVAHILVRSRQKAESIRSQLERGADFAMLAKQNSTDEQSASVGGELGCSANQQFAGPFASAAASLSLNEVSQPVQTEFGWHIILVHDTIPFESVRDDIRNSLAQGSSEGQARLDKLLTQAHVTVEPRYGRWRVHDGKGEVVPPKGGPQPPRAPAPSTSQSPSAPPPASAP